MPTRFGTVLTLVSIPLLMVPPLGAPSPVTATPYERAHHGDITVSGQLTRRDLPALASSN
jgi:hypothetical protein